MPESNKPGAAVEADLEGLLTSLEIRVETRRLDSLSFLEENARYMTGPEFQRLVANIKRDGVLTSVPLIYDLDESEGGPKTEILSGNHRSKAAIEAGLVESPMLVIVTRISAERRLAIQLAHNAIAGQDDGAILKRLYDSLGLDMKVYSGLTDDDFPGLKELDITGLSVANPTYEEMQFFFLPLDAQVVKEVVERLQKRPPKGTVIVGALDQYQEMFDLILRVKGSQAIVSAPVALGVLMQLASERLDQLDAEKAEAEKESAKFIAE